MESLAEILDSLRVSTALVSRAELGAPWSVRTEGARNAIFHVVGSGGCLARLDAEPDCVELARGDTVLFPRGHAHVLTTDPERAPVSITSIAPKRSLGVPILRYGGLGTTTSLLCGSFRFERDAAGTLASLLPSRIVVRGNSQLADWFEHTLALIDAELEAGDTGGSAIVNRLVDVVFAEIMRRSVQSAEEARGWFAAVHDPHVGRAIAAIHSRPGEHWSVDSLASEVGLSRTRLYERFTHLVGESPARYLARWRVTAAADLLRSRDISTAELAGAVGYVSEEAFARAFKRYVGVRPSEYKRAQRALV